MYKLVVLLSVVALSVAKPSLVAPLAYAAASPLAYSSVVAPASSSVSQYSTSVVHGAPAVHAYAAAPAVHAYAAPAVYGAAVAPLSLAHHTPAVVLGPHGVPLDTPEVVAARAQHFQAKALSGHYLKKRSLAAPVAYSGYSSVVASPAVSYAAAPLVSTYAASPLLSTYSGHYATPLAYSAPLAYSSHLVAPKAYSVHPW